jgi:hypothetical protein
MNKLVKLLFHLQYVRTNTGWMRKDNTSVMRTFALRASAFLGSRIKSDFVSPVKATSGYSIVSVI